MGQKAHLIDSRVPSTRTFIADVTATIYTVGPIYFCYHYLETMESNTFYIYRSKLLLSKSFNSCYLRSCIIGIAPNYPGVSSQAYSNGKKLPNACVFAGRSGLNWLFISSPCRGFFPYIVPKFRIKINVIH